MKQTLAPRQQVQFHAVGEYLYIHTAPDELRIRTQRGEYVLSERGQIKDAALSGLVTVENLADHAGLVEISSGFGEYIPPNDGQAVVVSHMPAVDVATIPPVSVDSMPEMEVKTLPPVQIHSIPAVNVETLPNVKLETGQAVRVYATNPVLTKPVGGATMACHTLTISDGEAVFAANSSRAHIKVKAAASNSGPILIGGHYPLLPGEAETLNTFGELALSGTD
ncbi:hypothetical protein, partial [Thaumasiovibrio sp. DFM-14]|uniref:hypothetical protein n=1 Tax=Thaumasiovibrio sp. DFM-14 TaxID=3384792 RepID=UPI0039A23671